jgi:hypothetical protein
VGLVNRGLWVFLRSDPVVMIRIRKTLGQAIIAAAKEALAVLIAVAAVAAVVAAMMTTMTVTTMRRFLQ